MTDHLWATATRLAPGALREAILEAHEAAQLPASAAGALADPREDDSHRSLVWEPGLGALVGEPLPATGAPRVGVRLAELALLVLDGHRGGEPETFPLAGRTRAEAYAWLAGMLERRGVEGGELAPPEFEIPPSPVGDGAPWSGTTPEARTAVASLYAASAGTLGALAAERDGASPVRCWPHHFDIATLLTLREGSEEEMKSIGVGMAPGGGGYDDWYVYVNVWPYPDPEGLPALAAGRWHTEGWIGAVLTGDEVAGSGENPARAVERFVNRAVEAGVRLLGEGG